MSETINVEVTIQDLKNEIYKFESTELGLTFLGKYGDLLYRHSMVEKYAYTFLVISALNKYLDTYYDLLKDTVAGIDEKERDVLEDFLDRFAFFKFFQNEVNDLADQDLLYDDTKVNLPGMVAFQTNLYSNLDNDDFTSKLTNKFSFNECTRLMIEAFSSNFLED